MAVHFVWDEVYASSILAFPNLKYKGIKMKEQLTLEKFNLIQNGEIFSTGETQDNSEGINMINSGDMLRWVAVKGYGNDWCIYAHWAYNSIEYVKDMGDKVFSKYNIQKLVPCTDEVYSLYRF